MLYICSNSSMRIVSARSFFVASLLVVSLSVFSSQTHAQVINTPTPTPILPTATPTPTTAVVDTPTPIIITDTPVPTIGATGPGETFAFLGVGSIALVLLGVVVFFAL